MTSSDSWHRPHFQSPSGSPFLFYVLFGEIDLGASLSASTYNVNAVPDELNVMSYDLDRHADTIRSFQEATSGTNLSPRNRRLPNKLPLRLAA